MFVYILNRKVVGYVTLRMSQIYKFQHNQLEKLSRHNNIPGILISEIARDHGYRNNRFGSHMIDFVAKLGSNLSKSLSQNHLSVYDYTT